MAYGASPPQRPSGSVRETTLVTLQTSALICIDSQTAGDGTMVRHRARYHISTRKPHATARR